MDGWVRRGKTYRSRAGLLVPAAPWVVARMPVEGAWAQVRDGDGTRVDNLGREVSMSSCCKEDSVRRGLTGVTPEGG